MPGVVMQTVAVVFANAKLMELLPFYCSQSRPSAIIDAL
jgi:hypothetical protein